MSVSKRLTGQQDGMMRARNLFFGIVILLLVFLSALFVVFIEHVRADKDNTTLYAIVFAALTTNLGVFAARMALSSEFDKQNLVLGAVEDKVNGGTERALGALREQHRVTLHDMKNELSNAMAKHTEQQILREIAEKKVAELESELRVCRENLVKKPTEKN